MWRESRTAYLRHLHLVVHTAQQRLRFPVYVIPSEEASPPRKAKRKWSCLPLCLPLLGLLTAIALLITLLFLLRGTPTCPTSSCLTATSTVVGQTSSSTSRPRDQLTYGDNCTEHGECMESKDLFCQYEYDRNAKHCFCETSHVWNRYRQQCEPKKEINEICEYDHQCRLDLGLTCDPVSPTSTTRRCRCSGEYYWSKRSNCGDLKVHDFVHCLDQEYLSSCLLREIRQGIYHNVNIRQIDTEHVEFDYFLVDSPELGDIERLECSWSMSKRYCFGINRETNQLWLTILGRQGIESSQQINQSVIGLPNVFTQIDQTVRCYVEGSNSTLLSITIDPSRNESIDVSPRGKTFGERSCFTAINQTIFCFYRDVERRLRLTMIGDSTPSQDLQLIVHTNTNLKTGPSCGWIGGNSRWKMFCFAVFSDEQIHRIEQIDSQWNDWIRMPSDKTFVQRPLFLTSKPADLTNTSESCHVLAIDTSNEVYVNSNIRCLAETSFSSWTLIEADIGMLSFNGTFRLRDGRVGVYGVGIDDLPYYTTINPLTDRFEPIQLAISTP